MITLLRNCRIIVQMQKEKFADGFTFHDLQSCNLNTITKQRTIDQPVVQVLPERCKGPTFYIYLKGKCT